MDQYFASIGFLPGLEAGGRIVDEPAGIRDLSFNAKYRLDLPWGAGLAVGATDIGGEAQNFQSRYAVATVPWQSLNFTLGYGAGPDVLKGTFGGIAWQPVPYAEAVVEHDTNAVNAGLKLNTGDWLGRVRVGADAIWRGETHRTEYGAHLEVAFAGDRAVPELAPEARTSFRGPTLLETLRNLGFESVRTGRRGNVQVVALENRVYNHSSADGLAVALSAVAAQMAPGTDTIELSLYAYGMPLLTVRTDPSLAHPDIRWSEGVADAGTMDWDEGSVDGLRSSELVLDPILRTFMATEYGVLDYSFAVRPRLVVPLLNGLIFDAGVQLPLINSNDFKAGQNFSGFATRGGLDLMLLQYAHAFAPGWTSLWSAGRSRVIRTDVDVVGGEQLWLSEEGHHQLRAKALVMRSSRNHDTWLAGYTWYDPAYNYSLGVSGGRYFFGDTGMRFDFTRYFGDVICGVYLKATSGGGDQAAGIQISLPLTPRRDAMPTGIQLKGPRRWSHSQGTTINLPDGTNSLRPALLYEPSLDLDLRRDFLDSGRLGAAYLQEELPKRLH